MLQRETSLCVRTRVRHPSDSLHVRSDAVSMHRSSSCDSEVVAGLDSSSKINHQTESPPSSPQKAQSVVSKAGGVQWECFWFDNVCSCSLMIVTSHW